MAQNKARKKGSAGGKSSAAKTVRKAAAKKPAAKRPAAKPKLAGKPRPVAKKAPAAAKKKPAPARAKPKAAVKARPAAKARPGAKPVAKAKPAVKVKPAASRPMGAPSAMAARPVAAAKPSAAAKPAPKRAVAVSHRPQNAAVAVQPRSPKKPAPPAGRTVGPIQTTSTLSEEQIRRAPDGDYMSDDQLAFFNDRLMQMRSEVLARELDVKERLHQREVFADPADRASAEEEHWLDLRLRERESLLLKKIDDALRRIRDKEYGYCEKTGEQIGIARLLARPTATVCVDIKGQDERAESQYRDR